MNSIYSVFAKDGGSNEALSACDSYNFAVIR